VLIIGDGFKTNGGILPAGLHQKSFGKYRKLGSMILLIAPWKNMEAFT
jgi:hypothetical protein